MNAFKLFISIVFTGIVVYGCTKDNDLKISSDTITGKTVRYTVLVVPGGGSSFKSTSGVDSAIVSLVMNDSVYSLPTDTNGLATFNNLAAGIAAVTVRSPNHTTANLIVDISAKKDSGYDSNNLRNAATMLALFPLSGPGTATIKGRTLADIDAVTPGLETAPAGLQVNAFIEKEQLVNYVNHTGDGEILSISYEQSTIATPTDASSDYTITVPATGSGLKIIVTSDDFAYNQAITGGVQRKIFKAITDTIDAVSGVTYFSDLKFE